MQARQTRMGVTTFCQQTSGYTLLMPIRRELIEPMPGDKRYVRRDDNGRFGQTVDVSASLAQDVRKRAKTVSKPGQGDKGDRRRPPSKKK
ncbi:MAG: hypothetical protein QOJ66_400 [Ilumatobacteraceae bacterium]